MPTAGIILPGGGYQGISQAGGLSELLPALKRNRIDITYVGGTSVGGLHSAKIAEGGTIDECIEIIKVVTDDIWFEIQRRGPEIVFPLTKQKFAWGFHTGACLDGSTLWGLVRGDLLGTTGINPAKIASSPIQLEIVVKNGLNHRLEVFSLQDSRFQKNPDEIINAIVATASLSPFFPAQKVFGVSYKDGRSIVPVLKRAILKGCDFIFILFPYQKDSINKPTDWFSRNFPGIIDLFLDVTDKSNELDTEVVEHAQEIARNIRARKTASSGFFTPWGRKKFDRIMDETGFTFSGKRDLVICLTYIEEKPPTLQVHTFDKKRGDLSRVFESSQDTMSKELRKLGLY